MKQTKIACWLTTALMPLTFVACKKDNTDATDKSTITVQNVFHHIIGRSGS